MRRLLNAKAIDILSKPVDEAERPPSYLDWCKQTSPEMSWDWDHTKYIADALDDVYAGKCKRLLISMPPQFGKSSCVTHRFPLYMMRYKPGSRVGLGSYNATYAKRLSRQAKRVAVQSGLKLGDKESAEEWELINGSNMYAVGMGGGVTGRSIDCLVGDTLIHTETGILRIDELVNMKERPRVLSYNHDEDRLEYKAVLKTKVSYAERLCELGDGTGRLIRCTGNHRIFTTESGYQEASSVIKGSHVFALTSKASLPTLPEQDGQGQSDVPAVLYRRSDSEQQSVQLDHPLPRVSPNPPPNTLEVKPVSVVRRLRTVRVPVYDITVEGNSNFFANEILVHNCWIIDDPVKSREEADSPTIRDKCWEWYLDDVTSRLQEGSPLILIMTRWHMDDLAGRILNSEESANWRYLRLPAIAEEDDPLGRPVGAPLCPERFSLQTLLDRQKQSPETFEALYQQNPVARGGSFFRREWFEIVEKPFGERCRRIRYWDLAYTKKETSAWTSGVLMSFDGVRYCVEHVERFRETPAERNERIRATLAHDVTMKGFERAYFEDQPAAGVEVAQNLVASCAGLPIQSSQIKGDKAIRAIPFADAARAGLVKIVRGAWTETFLNELTAFPRGATKDQVDSASSAFTRMAKGGLGIVV